MYWFRPTAPAPATNPAYHQSSYPRQPPIPTDYNPSLWQKRPPAPPTFQKTAPPRLLKWSAERPTPLCSWRWSLRRGWGRGCQKWRTPAISPCSGPRQTRAQICPCSPQSPGWSTGPWWTTGWQWSMCKPGWSSGISQTYLMPWRLPRGLLIGKRRANTLHYLGWTNFNLWPTGGNLKTSWINGLNQQVCPRVRKHNVKRWVSELNQKFVQFCAHYRSELVVTRERVGDFRRLWEEAAEYYLVHILRQNKLFTGFFSFLCTIPE